MPVTILENEDLGGGSGSSLPLVILLLASICTCIATVVSGISIYLHLKNYRKPALQRMVIRIMIMVPLYGISSLISIFSLNAAFFIDAVRDIYEAFVIYCFFTLLTTYLGGERNMLIMQQGRPPKPPVFPVNLWKREIDVSDPYTFLFLKRGILQYVQVKPVLAVVTVILKLVGKYNEGDLRARSGYLYVSVVYNTSITLALYCLAVFWLCVNQDIKPFRPGPKFICVKGILFFSFWQSLAISIAVAAGAISHLGPYSDPERISTGLSDTLLCFEMPLFAIAHNYAFSYRDFIDPYATYVARMPMFYAFRDAFGMLDVVEDTRMTLRGEGMDYREFEPSEGYIHQGDGRERRIRAGLRYSKGGKKKYWLPRPAEGTQPPGQIERGLNRAIGRVAGPDQTEDIQAPLLPSQADSVVHLAPDLAHDDEQFEEPTAWGPTTITTYGYELPFGDIDESDEVLFEHSKKFMFGDYNYPTIDCSSESAKMVMWDEEERVLRDERGAWFSPIRGAKGRIHLSLRDGPAWEGYGAVGKSVPPRASGTGGSAYSQSANSRLVDHNDLRQPSDNPKDVQLKWTNVNKPHGRPHSTASSSVSGSSSPMSPQQRSRNTSGLRYADGGPSSPSSSMGATASTRRPRADSGAGVSKSPPNSRSRKNSKKSTPPPVLPPDAVDLVVEDEEEVSSPSNSSKPGTPLRKVYRRGFVAHDNAGQEVHGEVDVEREEISSTEQLSSDPRKMEERADAGEELLSAVEEDSSEILSKTTREGDRIVVDEPSRERSETIARSTTPPIHAQIVVDPQFGEGDHENPWA